MYRLKNSFICSFWSWANVSSGDRDRSILKFLTWMGIGNWFWFWGFFLHVFGPSPGYVPFVYSQCTFGQLCCFL